MTGPMYPICTAVQCLVVSVDLDLPHFPFLSQCPSVVAATPARLGSGRTDFFATLRAFRHLTGGCYPRCWEDEGGTKSRDPNGYIILNAVFRIV